LITASTPVAGSKNATGTVSTSIVRQLPVNGTLRKYWSSTTTSSLLTGRPRNLPLTRAFIRSGTTTSPSRNVRLSPEPPAETFWMSTRT
jgi:hypothetical protein